MDTQVRREARKRMTSYTFVVLQQFCVEMLMDRGSFGTATNMLLEITAGGRRRAQGPLGEKNVAAKEMFMD